MSGWMIIGNRYPFTYTELPESLTLMRTDHSERINYVPERTTPSSLEVENKQLRELVKLAYDCATSGVSCHDCDLVFGKGNCQLKSDLENMGIEVD